MYIPPGDNNRVHLLDEVIGKIMQTHDHLLIGMDGNSINVMFSGTITVLELDLGVTWVCVQDLTRHQNGLKVD